jgi:hypothetical protein
LVLNIYRIFQNDTQRQTLHVYKLWLFGKWEFSICAYCIEIKYIEQYAWCH